MTGLPLRGYQEEALAAVTKAWEDGTQRPAVVLPTGAGKTVVFSHLAHRRPGRVVVLVHRDELARQTVAKFRAVSGEDAGVIKAADNDVDSRVIVASVQTLAREHRLDQLLAAGEIRTLIVDEAHHAVADSYRRIIDALGCPTVGFTATMGRGDGRALRDVWERIVYQRGVVDMIRRGHLVDPKGYRIDVPDLDLTGVRMSGGDFREGDLGRALTESLAPEVVAEAYAEHAEGLPGILFAPTVETAHLFGDALDKAGISSATVHGAMPTVERRAVLRDYDRGNLQVLSNCMVLTEGFDSPRAQVCVIARPTASEPLFVQMVGRVLRPYPGKAFAIVLDVVGATGRHSLVTLASLAGDPKVRRVQEGQTLLDAWDLAEDEEAETAERGWKSGPAVSTEVDLFGGSRQMWLRTEDGWWFIPVGERMIAIQPNPTEGWDVASWAKSKGGRWVAREIPDLELAMSLGEADITMDEQVYAEKTRSWRNRKATTKQVGYYVALGGSRELAEGMKAGELGNLISVRLASKRIDGPLKRYLARS